MLEIILIFTFWMVVGYILGRVGVGAKKTDTLTLPITPPQNIRAKLIALAQEKGWGLIKEEQLQNGLYIELQAGQYGWSRQGAQYLTLKILTTSATTTSVFIESRLVMSQLIDHSKANINNITLIKDALLSPTTNNILEMQSLQFPPKKILFAKNFIILLGCACLLGIAMVAFLVVNTFNGLNELRTLDQETTQKLKEYKLQEQERMEELRRTLKISTTPSVTGALVTPYDNERDFYRLDFIFIPNLPEDTKQNLLTNILSLKQCTTYSATLSICYVPNKMEQSKVAIRSLNYSWITQLLAYEMPIKDISQTTNDATSNEPQITPPINKEMYPYRADIIFTNSISSSNKEAILDALSFKKCYSYEEIYSCYFETDYEYLRQIEKISKRGEVEQVIRYTK